MKMGKSQHCKLSWPCLAKLALLLPHPRVKTDGGDSLALLFICKSACELRDIGGQSISDIYRFLIVLNNGESICCNQLCNRSQL